MRIMSLRVANPARVTQGNSALRKRICGEGWRCAAYPRGELDCARCPNSRLTVMARPRVPCTRIRKWRVIRAGAGHPVGACPCASKNSTLSWMARFAAMTNSGYTKKYSKSTPCPNICALKILPWDGNSPSAIMWSAKGDHRFCVGI